VKGGERRGKGARHGWGNARALEGRSGAIGVPGSGPKHLLWATVLSTPSTEECTFTPPLQQQQQQQQAAPHHDGLTGRGRRAQGIEPRGGRAPAQGVPPGAPPLLPPGQTPLEAHGQGKGPFITGLQSIRYPLTGRRPCCS
jgi:hypothetical protein